jgi:hypothetical protein
MPGPQAPFNTGPCDTGLVLQATCSTSAPASAGPLQLQGSKSPPHDTPKAPPLRHHNDMEHVMQGLGGGGRLRAIAMASGQLPQPPHVMAKPATRPCASTESSSLAGGGYGGLACVVLYLCMVCTPPAPEQV